MLAADVSTPTMGRDRELFINMVLSNIISVPFRLGTGDIVDRNDKKSRQADIVIEYANTLSFPSIYPHSARLYLAESVCATVEVKSTLSTRWPDIKDAATALQKLDRHVGEIASVGPPPPKKIPLFVVGYTGWVEAKTASDNLEKMNAHGDVARERHPADRSMFLRSGEAILGSLVQWTRGAVWIFAQH
jgi:Domain of unknown function (DUF6602)